jgi:hypothetical protein
MAERASAVYPRWAPRDRAFTRPRHRYGRPPLRGSGRRFFPKISPQALNHRYADHPPPTTRTPAATLASPIKVRKSRAFTTYDQIQVIINGGPGTDTTTTLAFNVVTAEFSANRVGYSSAYAVVMLVLVAALAIVILRYLQRCEQRI